MDESWCVHNGIPTIAARFIISIFKNHYGNDHVATDYGGEENLLRKLQMKGVASLKLKELKIAWLNMKHKEFVFNRSDTLQKLPPRPKKQDYVTHIEQFFFDSTYNSNINYDDNTTRKGNAHVPTMKALKELVSNNNYQTAAATAAAATTTTQTSEIARNALMEQGQGCASYPPSYDTNGNRKRKHAQTYSPPHAAVAANMPMLSPQEQLQLFHMQGYTKNNSSNMLFTNPHYKYQAQQTTNRIDRNSSNNDVVDNNDSMSLDWMEDIERALGADHDTDWGMNDNYNRHIERGIGANHGTGWDMNDNYNRHIERAIGANHGAGWGMTNNNYNRHSNNNNLLFAQHPVAATSVSAAAISPCSATANNNRPAVHIKQDPDGEAVAGRGKAKQNKEQQRNEEQDSITPRNGLEMNFLRQLQQMGFTDVREIIAGIRSCCENGNASIDEIMIKIISRREEAEEAEKMDQARILSEQSRKTQAKRLRKQKEIEFQNKLLRSTIYQWKSNGDMFPNSWILKFYYQYKKNNKMDDDNNKQNIKKFSCGNWEQIFDDDNTYNFNNHKKNHKDDKNDTIKESFIRLLKLEKLAFKWYGSSLPKNYFEKVVCENNLVCDSIVQFEKNVINLSEGVEHALYSLSAQEGGVPRMFLEHYRKKKQHDSTNSSKQKNNNGSKNGVNGKRYNKHKNDDGSDDEKESNSSPPTLLASDDSFNLNNHNVRNEDDDNDDNSSTDSEVIVLEDFKLPAMETDSIKYHQKKNSSLPPITMSRNNKKIDIIEIL